MIPVRDCVRGCEGGAFAGRKRWELDRMGELFRIAAKSRSGGMADASDSKSGGLNAREGSTPSFGMTTEEYEEYPQISQMADADHADFGSKKRSS